jgi:hypothetical protein
MESIKVMATVNDYNSKDEEAATGCTNDTDVDNPMALSAPQPVRPVLTHDLSFFLL